MENRPAAVVRADSILQRAETIADHERRAWQILDAFRELTAYLNRNPGSDCKEYVQNRMQSYLLQHLRQVCAVEEPDNQTRIWYFAVFALYREEVEQVLNRHPEFRSWHDACLQCILDASKRT